MCVIKELPIAGYSVVKESAFARFAGFGETGRLAASRQNHSVGRGPSTRAPRSLRACHERGGEAAEPNGGEYRARTGDLLVANQALSQLS